MKSLWVLLLVSALVAADDDGNNNRVSSDSNTNACDLGGSDTDKIDGILTDASITHIGAGVDITATSGSKAARRPDSRLLPEGLLSLGSSLIEVLTRPTPIVTNPVLGGGFNNGFNNINADLGRGISPFINSLLVGFGRGLNAKQGSCPPVRPSCPNTRNFAPPTQCFSDTHCKGVDKCCFDTCLQHDICKPPVGFGR